MINRTPVRQSSCQPNPKKVQILVKFGKKLHSLNLKRIASGYLTTAELSRYLIGKPEMSPTQDMPVFRQMSLHLLHIS